MLHTGQWQWYTLKVKYKGASYHKRNPGDFGLRPPAQPRPDKTLCDEAGIRRIAEAQRLLAEGIRRGLVGDDDQSGFPKYIWAATSDDIALQACHTGQGEYHGYPLPDWDPFRDKVLRRWRQA
jgi:hypothetical protein